MPTYEYECEVCRRRFEKFQSMTAPPLKRCMLCGSRRIHRLIGAGAGIIFKGSGFYQTDYRNTKKSKEREKAKEGEATSDSD